MKGGKKNTLCTSSTRRVTDVRHGGSGMWQRSLLSLSSFFSCDKNTNKHNFRDLFSPFIMLVLGYKEAVFPFSRFESKIKRIKLVSKILSYINTPSLYAKEWCRKVFFFSLWWKNKISPFYLIQIEKACLTTLNPYKATIRRDVGSPFLVNIKLNNQAKVDIFTHLKHRKALKGFFLHMSQTGNKRFSVASRLLFRRATRG